MFWAWTASCRVSCILEDSTDVKVGGTGLVGLRGGSRSVIGWARAIEVLLLSPGFTAAPPSGPRLPTARLPQMEVPGRCALWASFWEVLCDALGEEELLASALGLPVGASPVGALCPEIEETERIFRLFGGAVFAAVLGQLCFGPCSFLLLPSCLTLCLPPPQPPAALGPRPHPRRSSEAFCGQLAAAQPPPWSLLVALQPPARFARQHPAQPRGVFFQESLPPGVLANGLGPLPASDPRRRAHPPVAVFSRLSQGDRLRPRWMNLPGHAVTQGPRSALGSLCCWASCGSGQLHGGLDPPPECPQGVPLPRTPACATCSPPAPGSHQGLPVSVAPSPPECWNHARGRLFRLASPTL